MQDEPHFNYNKFYKLVALWVVIEVFLGGIIHAFHLPITGLIVASGAVFCISHLAFYNLNKLNILKATIIVVVLKFILSPHTPITAYFAVFFQGLFASILFAKNKYFKLKCIVFATISFFESAIQKVLILLLVYGKNFFTAFDEFVTKITHQKTTTSYSYYIAVSYIIIHILVGLIVGYYVYKSTLKTNTHLERYKFKLYINDNINYDELNKNRKLRKLIGFVFILTIMLVILKFNNNGVWIKTILRPLLILTFWLIIIQPIAKYFLSKFISNNQNKYAKEIAAVVDLLPQTKSIIQQCWQKSKLQKTENKFSYFIKSTYINVLQ